MKKATQEKAMINGPAGRLEALLSYAADHGSYIAVICHPHPLHGGTMRNKVVHTMARVCHEMGAPVLRFNFRGVGASEGEFGHTVGEAGDLAACVQWMRDKYPGRHLLLAGFSFGSYVAAKMAARLGAHALISIAPPVNLYEFGAIEAPQEPWLVVQGGKDEVVPADEVRQWAGTTTAVNHLAWMADASHFFHGRLLDLSAVVKEWLETAIDMGGDDSEFDPG